jgi:hypothetical protein
MTLLCKVLTSFPLVPPGKFRDIISFRPQPSVSKSFLIQQRTYHPTLYSFIHSFIHQWLYSPYRALDSNIGFVIYLYTTVGLLG